MRVRDIFACILCKVIIVDKKGIAHKFDDSIDTLAKYGDKFIDHIDPFNDKGENVILIKLDN